MSAKRHTVLVAEDDQPLRDFVRRNLEVRGYNVLAAGNGLEAMGFFNSESIDLVVVDLMMPHMDGLEVIRRIRKVSQVPVVVLSAMDEEADKVRALNLGADDYLTKPFGVDELLARIQAVIRRSRWSGQPAGSGQLAYGDLVVDLEGHKARYQGRDLELTPTEYELLTYLMANAGKVLSHKAILQQVWGPEYGQETEYLRVYIGRLRGKIEDDPAAPRYIVTERGVGYSFVGG
jgi:two-component system KDP operon response regulator KdpE